MTNRWYVATTKGSQQEPEHVAARNLVNQGLRAWVPITYRRAETVRKSDPLAQPRFRGYVFVYFDADREEHSPINSTIGVGKLLCDRDEMRTPRPLPAGLVEGLQVIELDEYAAARATAGQAERHGMAPGDVVRIARLDNQIGSLVGSRDGQATVLVGNRLVTVSVLDITPAAVDTRKKYAA